MNQGIGGRKGKAGQIILIFFLLVSLLFVGELIYYYSIRPKSSGAGEILPLELIRVAMAPQSTFPGRQTLRILLLGLDVNWTRNNIPFTKNSRSDTIMLANLDMEHRRISLISIPRDTRVQIPGYGTDKINSAHSLGGPVLTQRVVQDLLNVPIDYYAVVKINGFKNIIDAVGGLELDVEKDMDYDDNWGHLHIHLKKGWQQLNGERAVGYSRFRNDAEADYGRIRRQQQVIKALQKKMLEPSNLLRLPSLARIGVRNTESNMNWLEVLSLVNIFKSIQRTDIKMGVIPTTPQEFFEGGYWISYVIADEEGAKKLVDRLIWGKGWEQEEQPLTVAVLNGSGKFEKAQEVKEKLEEAGFKVIKLGNADRFDYQYTQIIDHTGKGNFGAVANVIPGESFSVPEEKREVDITVIVGRDL